MPEFTAGDCLYVSERWRITGGTGEHLDDFSKVAERISGSIDAFLDLLLKESPQSDGWRITALLPAASGELDRRLRAAGSCDPDQFALLSAIKHEFHQQVGEQAKARSWSERPSALTSDECEKRAIPADDRCLWAVLREDLCQLPNPGYKAHCVISPKPRRERPKRKEPDGATASLQDPSFWRALRKEFDDLAARQRSVLGQDTHPKWLRAYCGFSEAEGESDHCERQGGVDGPLISAFDELATRAAFGLGCRADVEPVQFWLSCLGRDLINAAEPDVRNEFTGKWSGYIQGLLESCGGYCLRLATEAERRRAAGVRSWNLINLTSQQKGLLVAIVDGHIASEGKSFIFVHNSSGRALIYEGGYGAFVDADRSDFVQLRRERLIIFTSQKWPSLTGKPTQSGIDAAVALRKILGLPGNNSILATGIGGTQAKASDVGSGKGTTSIGQLMSNPLTPEMSAIFEAALSKSGVLDPEPYRRKLAKMQRIAGRMEVTVEEFRSQLPRLLRELGLEIPNGVLQSPKGRRGRKSIFTQDQLEKAFAMKQAGKKNNEIAKVLYLTPTPTAAHRRSVPTALKHHFGPKKEFPGIEK